MSVCVSRQGEYGSHKPDAEFVCNRCWALDEEGLRAGLKDLRDRTNAIRALAERLIDVSDIVDEKTGGTFRYVAGEMLTILGSTVGAS